jgi:hypothetical protein
MGCGLPVPFVSCPFLFSRPSPAQYRDAKRQIGHPVTALPAAVMPVQMAAPPVHPGTICHAIRAIPIKKQRRIAPTLLN